MPRVATSRLGLGTWLQGEKPGAGSQTVKSGNTGLNGNWLILDDALGVGHNTDGTHKDDIISGASLVNTIVDGSTLEASAATGAKAFRVKDAGITAAKLASDAVTTVKILDANVTAAKLASDAVTTVKILDANVTLGKMAADSVDASKITHDNTARKQTFEFAVIAGATMHNGAAMDTTFVSGGIPMLRAGYVTKIMACSAAGAVANDSHVYGTAGSAFAAGDKMSLYWDDTGNTAYQPMINGSPIAALVATLTGSITNAIISIEVEYDD